MNVENFILNFLNIEAFYYWIYSTGKSFFSYLLPKNAESPFDFLTIWNYSDKSVYLSETEKISKFGEGIGAESGGYSLFNSSDFWVTFFNNPYCVECSTFSDFFIGGWNAFFYISIFIFFIFILWIKGKNKFLEEKERIIYDTVYKKESLVSQNIQEKKWQEIVTLLNSTNQNDWKAAIIDADNFLEKILEDNGYTGASVGEKLKNANFATLQDAWAGHKVRNQIAHDSDFNLTHREAKHVISNFEKVFNELSSN